MSALNSTATLKGLESFNYEIRETREVISAVSQLTRLDPASSFLGMTKRGRDSSKAPPFVHDMVRPQPGVSPSETRLSYRANHLALNPATLRR